MTFEQFVDDQLEKDAVGLLDILVEMAMTEGDAYSAEETEASFIDAAKVAFEVYEYLTNMGIDGSIKMVSSDELEQLELEGSQELSLEDLIESAKKNILH